MKILQVSIHVTMTDIVSNLLLLCVCSGLATLVYAQPSPLSEAVCSRYYSVNNNTISLGDGGGLAKQTMDATAAYAYYDPLFQSYAAMLVMYQQVGSAIGDIINRSAPTLDTVVPRPSLTSIYSFVFVNTAGSPAPLFKLTVPNVPAGVTYYSVSILDGYTEQLLPTLSNQEENDETTDDLETFYVYGRGYDASQLPQSSLSYECRTQYCWILNRFAITANSTDQINRIQEWQSELSIEASPGGMNEYLQPVTIPMLLKLRSANSDIESFFNLVNTLSVDSPPGRLADKELLDSFQSVNVGPGETFSLDSFDEDVQEEMKIIPECFKRMLRDAQIGYPAGPGWTYSPPTGIYLNYLDRAYISLVGLGATVPAELTYASTGPLMGAHRMDFGPDDYPDAWQWSLTPYNQTGNIVPNPYNIYSVNNRSPNLNVSADGGLAVVFQETPPKFEKGINWVPIPGNRTLYNILFRITLGGKDVLDRTYQVPGIFAIQ